VFDLAFARFILSAGNALAFVVVLEPIHLHFVVDLIAGAGRKSADSRAAEECATPPAKACE
jgi:hypothetical protein